VWTFSSNVPKGVVTQFDDPIQVTGGIEEDNWVIERLTSVSCVN
jgi:phosphoribosylformimino-5-aminoimidazole carboxamide ribonucleotide (ProFAR) isomerase